MSAALNVCWSRNAAVVGALVKRSVVERLGDAAVATGAAIVKFAPPLFSSNTRPAAFAAWSMKLTSPGAVACRSARDLTAVHWVVAPPTRWRATESQVCGPVALVNVTQTSVTVDDRSPFTEALKVTVEVSGSNVADSCDRAGGRATLGVPDGR